MTYLGIDPGLQGALVIVDEAGAVVDSLKMPRVGGTKGPLDVARLADWLEAWFSPGACACLEDIQGRPNAKMGVTSALTSGRNHGRIEGLLLAQGWRYELTPVARWQKAMHAGTSEGGKDPKARSILAARRLLPSLDLTPGRKTKPDDNIADAGLLALYCRRTMGGR